MKHFILPIALGLALVSCRDTSGVDNLPEETPILPVKITDGAYIREYKYNGDKLTEYTQREKNSYLFTRNVVEYIGDYITSITVYDEMEKSNMGARQRSKFNFKYANGKLVEFVIKRNEGKTEKTEITTTYQYNNDGTITKIDRWGDNKTATYIVKVVNGNIIQQEKPGGVYVEHYKYDTKNNPFKNVKGMSAFVVNAVDDSNTNNIIEKEGIDSQGSFSYKYTYTYEYNTDNFPTKQIVTYKNGSTSITTKTATYTYNK